MTRDVNGCAGAPPHADRPGGARLARVLDDVRAMPDVWICKRIDIARHWMERHPPQGRTP